MKFFTVSELARRLEVSENSVRSYDDAGLMKAIRVGPKNMRLFSEEAVKTFERLKSAKAKNSG